MYNYNIHKLNKEFKQLKSYYAKYYNSAKPRKNKLLDDRKLMDEFMTQFNHWLQTLILNHELGEMERIIMMQMMMQHGNVYDRKGAVVKLMKTKHADKVSATVDKYFNRFVGL